MNENTARENKDLFINFSKDVSKLRQLHKEL